MKKTIVVILIFILASFLICSCTTYENINLIEQNDVEYCLYNENKYYFSSIFDTREYNIIADENDVKLGWYYSFPFGTDFYSDTADNPEYIYTVGSVSRIYLKQSYDYKSEIFVIDNTSEAFVFSEAITDTAVEYDFQMDYFNDFIHLKIYSKNHTNLTASLRLFRKNNDWCVAFPTNESYLISQSFVLVLKNNGIIE